MSVAIVSEPRCRLVLIAEFLCFDVEEKRSDVFKWRIYYPAAFFHIDSFNAIVAVVAHINPARARCILNSEIILADLG